MTCAPTLEFTDIDVPVPGGHVHVRRHPSPGDPAAIFVHGARAHSGWWEPMLAHLTGSYDLTLVELTGHGDSSHRAEYSGQSWADEVVAVITALDLRQLRVVGHSMGGKVATGAAAGAADRVASLVLIDTTFRDPDDGHVFVPSDKPMLPYPSRESALARFRLMPGGTIAPDDVVRTLAERAIRPTPEGWVWKADVSIRGPIVDDDTMRGFLARLQCPIGFIRGRHSSITDAGTPARVQRSAGRPVIAAEIDIAHHHVPVDAPAECATALEQIWSQLHAAPAQPPA